MPPVHCRYCGQYRAPSPMIGQCAVCFHGQPTHQPVPAPEYPGATVARLVIALSDPFDASNPCTFPGAFAPVETTGRIRHER